MRFYGVQEDKLLEVIDKIKDGLWVFEEDSRREELSSEDAKRKVLELVERVKAWKEGNRHIPVGTVFFFVSTPDDPKAFKVYDLSSLGCSVSLNPAKYKLYSKELLPNLENS